MSTRALDRLRYLDWIGGKFADFVKGIYHEIDAAIEVITNEKFSLIIATNNTIEIITSERKNNASLTVNIESIPLRDIKNIETKFKEFDLEPNSRVHPHDHVPKVTIRFFNRDDLNINLIKVVTGDQVEDLLYFIQRIKKSI